MSYHRRIPSNVERIRAALKLLAALMIVCAMNAQTQPASVVLNESTIIRANPLRIGVVNASTSNYDSGQYYTNWLAQGNPSFQGTNYVQVAPVQSGTTTKVTGSSIYDAVPLNFWAGATITGIASPGNSGFMGETATVSSNTQSNGSTTGPVYTISSVAKAAASGDWISLISQNDYTPAGLCQGLSGGSLSCAAGWNYTASSGAVIGAQSADLPSGTYDKQTLTVDTTASGASATIYDGLDASYPDKTENFLTFWSGTSYTFSMKCKVLSGASTAVINFKIQRTGGGQNSSGNATCTNSWSTISYVFNGTESTSTPINIFIATMSFPQGSKVAITDTFLGLTTQSNPTVYKDSYVNALKAMGPDTLRLWDGGVGDTFDDMITPSWGRHSSSYSLGGYSLGTNTIVSGIYDHLWLCQYIGVNTCTIVVPAAWSTADYQHLVQFIAGTSGTYPTKRNALDAIYSRPSGSFAAAIPQIIIELTDEPWNSSGAYAGEAMPAQNDGYNMTAYGQRANTVFQAIKGDSTYTSNIKTAINCQTGAGGPTTTCGSYVIPQIANNGNYADYIVLTNYFSTALNTVATPDAEWNPETGFAYQNAHDPTNGWVKRWVLGVASQLPLWTGKFAIYEGGEGTTSGSATNAQIVAHGTAMINAAEDVQGYMETMAALGITPQNVFTASQDYYTPTGNPIWGIFKDPDGGQLAGSASGYRFRAPALGYQIANACIGQGSTMYSAAMSGENTYSTSASNGQPAWGTTPYLTAYAFANGSNRCLLFTNTDPVNAAQVSITGTNAPTTVTENLLSGSSISANNEGPTPGVTIVTTAGKSVAPTYTVPPYSVTAISWTVSVAASISNVQFSGVTETSATITWTTSVPATSQVSYGASTAYGSLTQVNSTLVTSHSVTLTGLSSGVLYDFTVLSTTGTGTALTAPNYSFTTVAAPLIANVQSTGVSPTSATITWTTNTPTTSLVTYGTSLAYGSSTPVNTALVTSHSVSLTGLTNSTLYDYTVQSTDATGDQVTSANNVFTTATPLVLSNVQVSGISATGATVTWTTSTPASSQVIYGTTTAYGLQTTVNSTLVTSHSVVLTGLSPNTPYDFSANSTDGSGNQMLSSNQAFTTLNAPPAISGVQTSGITATGATITWTTNTPTTSRVVYAASVALATPLNVSLVTTHSVPLTGLTPATRYSFIVQSADSTGNQATSAASVFTTSTRTPSVTAAGDGYTYGSVTSATTGTGGTALGTCAAGSAAFAAVSSSYTNGVTYSVSDSASNSGWRAYGAQSTLNGGLTNSQIFYNPSLTSRITSVTGNISPSASFAGVGVSAICFSLGSLTGSADFAQVTSSGTNTSTVTGRAFTSTAATEIVLGGIFQQNTGIAATATGSWRTATSNTNSGMSLVYQIFSTTQTGQTFTASLGSNNNYGTITVALK